MPLGTVWSRVAHILPTAEKLDTILNCCSLIGRIGQQTCVRMLAIPSQLKLESPSVKGATCESHDETGCYLDCAVIWIEQKFSQ